MRIFHRVFAILIFIITVCQGFSQTISQRLTQAVRQFESDPQMKHAIMSLYVIDAKTGKKVYARNEQIGLAPASTQKLFTSAAAFELLGKSYTYQTRLGYGGRIEKGVLKGNLYIVGSGDPTLGSWRFNSTNEDTVINRFAREINKQGIKKIQGSIWGNTRVGTQWPDNTIPDGWIWQDIGNYYGAGADAINWRENQYDLVLKSGGSIGDEVTIVTTTPRLYQVEFNCQVKSAAKNSGDNAYIYLPPLGDYGIVRGTIPINESAFVISGSLPKPTIQVISTLKDKLRSEGIIIADSLNALQKDSAFMNDRKAWQSLSEPITLYVHNSPPLDSINYWFMKRSINLYGEALIKTISLIKTDTASTESGVEIVRDFWSGIGIDKSAIQVIDGSGLSPQNRVTTHAEVSVLQYARTRPWFQSFYYALPEYNGMKMKSGSIGGARAYAGYHKAKDGNEYIFSIIVNNYDGSSGEVVRKMYRVLNELK